MNSTEELDKIYGKTRQDTDVLGLGCWKLCQNILFKDGKKRKLIHIECRNMAVDLLRFDDGTELFTGDIKDSFDFKINLKDFSGNIIYIGDDLKTKWGGVGTVVIEFGKILISFESGNYKPPLDIKCINYRELIIYKEAKNRMEVVQDVKN